MGADMTRGILLPIFSRVWLLILVSKPRAWFAVIVILLRIFGLILTIGWGILLFTRPYYYSWLRDYNLHKPRASYCLWPQGSISYQFNFQGVRYNNHDLLLDLITYHFRQAVLDCLAKKNLNLLFLVSQVGSWYSSFFLIGVGRYLENSNVSNTHSVYFRITIL